MLQDLVNLTSALGELDLLGALPAAILLADDLGLGGHLPERVALVAHDLRLLARPVAHALARVQAAVGHPGMVARDGRARRGEDALVLGVPDRMGCYLKSYLVGVK